MSSEDIPPPPPPDEDEAIQTVHLHNNNNSNILIHQTNPLPSRTQSVQPSKVANANAKIKNLYNHTLSSKPPPHHHKDKDNYKDKDKDKDKDDNNSTDDDGYDSDFGTKPVYGNSSTNNNKARRVRTVAEADFINAGLHPNSSYNENTNNNNNNIDNPSYPLSKNSFSSSSGSGTGTGGSGGSGSLSIGPRHSSTASQRESNNNRNSFTNPSDSFSDDDDSEINIIESEPTDTSETFFKSNPHTHNRAKSTARIFLSQVINTGNSSNNSTRSSRQGSSSLETFNNQTSVDGLLINNVNNPNINLSLLGSGPLPSSSASVSSAPGTPLIHSFSATESYNSKTNNNINNNNNTTITTTTNNNNNNVSNLSGSSSSKRLSFKGTGKPPKPEGPPPKKNSLFHESNNLSIVTSSNNSLLPKTPSPLTSPVTNQSSSNSNVNSPIPISPLNIPSSPTHNDSNNPPTQIINSNMLGPNRRSLDFKYPSSNVPLTPTVPALPTPMANIPLPTRSASATVYSNSAPSNNGSVASFAASPSYTFNTPASPTHGPINSGSGKTQCATSSCLSFAVGGEFCLRHAYKEAVLEAEPQFAKAYKVAKELLDTERTYCDGLRVATRSFKLRLDILLQASYAATGKNADGTPVSGNNLPSPGYGSMTQIVAGLSQDDLNLIFNNIELIAKLSEQLHSDFTTLYHERVMVSYIGSTLLHFAPQFRIYQPYLENYDDAVRRLKQVRDKNPDLDSFIKLTEKCEGMSLESFLIMPVQRLPRYLLLLAELSKALPPTDDAGIDVANAADKIKRIASAINISLKGKEEQLKVLAIQNQFERDARFIELVTPNRYLVKDGILKKRFSEKSRHIGKSQHYHFFLFNDLLVYAAFSKNTFLKGTTYKLKKFVSVSEMTVAADLGPKGKNRDILVTMNHLSSDKKTMALVAESTSIRDEWLKAFQEAIDIAVEDSHVLKVQNFDGSAHSHSLGPGPGSGGMAGASNSSGLHESNNSLNLSGPIQKTSSKLQQLTGIGHK